MKTIVVGLGNPVLGDDGIGWKIAEEVRLAFDSQADALPEVDVECLALGGLSLMEHLVGYDRAILIDSINMPGFDMGSIHHFRLEDLPNPSSGHLTSSHDTSLQKALEVGISLGAHLPQEIHVVAVQSRLVYEFSEALSEPVAASISPASALVMDLLRTGMVEIL